MDTLKRWHRTKTNPEAWKKLSLQSKTEDSTVSRNYGQLGAPAELTEPGEEEAARGQQAPSTD